MDLDDLRTRLHSVDIPTRLRAVLALRTYSDDLVYPLLGPKLQDPDFAVRTAVVQLLGDRQTPQTFDLLLQQLEQEDDANVQAEIVQALRHFGIPALPVFSDLISTSTASLTRRTALAALISFAQQPDLQVNVFNRCVQALTDSSASVQAMAIDGLAVYANTPLRTSAIDKLVPLTSNSHWQIRFSLVKALRQFDCHQAREALLQLSQDPNHHVVGAVLEALVP
ncbi:MAG: HEAT repeat domain-containing protein [Cyanobacteria bacterium P01_H01_bin.121]